MSDGPTLSEDDVQRLQRLRAQYLARSESGDPRPLDGGFRDARDVELYDLAYATRIGWKWRAVLDEMEGLGIGIPKGPVLDWGAGTGIATRAWLAREAARNSAERVDLWDTSRLALKFARTALAANGSRIPLHFLERAPAAAPAVLLVSHVLGELDEETLDGLVALAGASALVVWVEPGSRAISRRLSAVHERLRDELAILAPCPHRGACGMLADGCENDWCHHMARPAPEAHTTRVWREIAGALGIDMRSLPYSFLILARTPRTAPLVGAVRVLGRPRVEKGRVLLDVCTPNGIQDLRLLARIDRDIAGELGETPERALNYRIEAERGAVKAIERLRTPWTRERNLATPSHPSEPG